ncbi:hypothetical protein LJ753_16830 [Arthrobacter sp. zg-Y20]|uniref:hypothetical protein n=1 Tax=unclassified Arthrobacter TaxID=235627 RepID=UPI001D149100|nr:MULTISPECIES: hypothetical protein [unclassified Arthrobacter]MCC3277531.1 hypothetical protein [Arthrobacter sp. zg-Y20]MDK1317689.1 hypothetical protein [Arthrobacter sp. zg.Y20]WIB07052.1 hypothetical protein QNO06_04810 [Arthrobacter sp. zg-Y20]
MAEVIEFPNPAVWAIKYLTPLMVGEFAVPVMGEVPDPRPKRFVTFQNAGGDQQTLVSDAGQLMVECWDSTDPKAERLMARVRALMAGVVGQKVDGIRCYKVEQMGRPAYVPDPNAKVPRYRQNIRIHLRGYRV